MISPQFMRLCAMLAIVSLASVSPSPSHEEHPHDRAATPHAVAPARAHSHHKKADALMPSADASVYTTRIVVQGGFRYITSDGLPDAPHGEFPNRGNPNVISEQRYSLRVPVKPVELPNSIPGMPHLFGIALDGIPFDPGTAEFWRNDPASGWHGEAMGAPMKLGLDMNNAHVQPSGAYHYHGIPSSLLRRLGTNKQTLIGYAADGFPIYGPLCQESSENSGRLRSMKPSYRLRSGTRPGGMEGPGGRFDGTYTEDYEYVEGCGDLDECNGRYGATAEFPNGTYYYVLTEAFPYVPRRWHGQPDPSFFKAHHGRPGMRGRPTGPPPAWR